jgi:hypothetical protein
MQILKRSGKHRKPVMHITGQGLGKLSGKKGRVLDMFSKSPKFLWIVIKILCFIKSFKLAQHVILEQRVAFTEIYILNLMKIDHELGYPNQ